MGTLNGIGYDIVRNSLGKISSVYFRKANNEFMGSVAVNRYHGLRTVQSFDSNAKPLRYLEDYAIGKYRVITKERGADKKVVVVNKNTSDITVKKEGSPCVTIEALAHKAYMESCMKDLRNN